MDIITTLFLTALTVVILYLLNKKKNKLLIAKYSRYTVTVEGHDPITNVPYDVKNLLIEQAIAQGLSHSVLVTSS